MPVHRRPNRAYADAQIEIFGVTPEEMRSAAITIIERVDIGWGDPDFARDVLGMLGLTKSLKDLKETKDDELALAAAQHDAVMERHSIKWANEVPLWP